MSDLHLATAAPQLTGEDPRFLQQQLITYIGNKRALLPFLAKGLSTVQRRLGREKLRTLDLFSGTGVVSRFLKRYSGHLIVNDLETYSRVTNECYLANHSEVDRSQLEEMIAELEQEIAANWSEGFICELYAPRDEQNITPDDRVFYTRRNAAYLDTARQCIARLPTGLQKFALAPLLAEASVHANTSGVFKGFYKNSAGVGQFGGSGQNALTRILGEIRVCLPIFSRYECETTIHQRDANELVHELPEVDLAYMDPPYNQHPYGSNYFMLNLVAEYQRPEEVSRVSGIPTDWNRSRFNQRAEVEDALFGAIQACPAKFVLISYNSEGFIPHDRFLARLKECGRLDVLETTYNTFRGSRNLRGRSIHVQEFLYLLEK